MPTLAPPLGVCPRGAGPLVLGVAGLICLTPGALGCRPGLSVGSLEAEEAGLEVGLVILGWVTIFVGRLDPFSCSPETQSWLLILSRGLESQQRQVQAPCSASLM